MLSTGQLLIFDTSKGSGSNSAQTSPEVNFEVSLYVRTNYRSSENVVPVPAMRFGGDRCNRKW